MEERVQEYPYRFKLYDEEAQLESKLSDAIKHTDLSTIHRFGEDDLSKITAIFEDVRSGVLSTYLKDDPRRKQMDEYILYGTYLNNREKDLLQYLICLRYGLPRDKDVERRIYFGKISYLIKLLSPIDKWNLPSRRKYVTKYANEICQRRKILKPPLDQLLTTDNESTLIKSIRRKPISIASDSVRKSRASLKMQGNKDIQHVDRKASQKVNKAIRVTEGNMLSSSKTEKSIITKSAKSVTPDSNYDPLTVISPLESTIQLPRQSPCYVKSKSSNPDVILEKIQRKSSSDATKLLPQVPFLTSVESVESQVYPKKLIVELPTLGDEYLECFDKNLSIENKDDLSDDRSINSWDTSQSQSERGRSSSLTKRDLSFIEMQSSNNKQHLSSSLTDHIQSNDNLVNHENTEIKVTERRNKIESTNDVCKLPKVADVALTKDSNIRKKRFKGAMNKNQIAKNGKKKKITKRKFEVDLGMMQSIQKVILQLESNGDKKMEKKSESFTLEYSNDCIDWLKYEDASGETQEFREDNGNYVCMLSKDIFARYIRINLDKLSLHSVKVKVEPKDSHEESLQKRRVREGLVKPIGETLNIPLTELVEEDLQIHEQKRKMLVHKETKIVFSIPPIPGTLDEADLTFDENLKEILNGDGDYPVHQYPSRKKDCMFTKGDTLPLKKLLAEETKKQQVVQEMQKRKAMIKIEKVKTMIEEKYGGGIKAAEVEGDDTFFEKYCLISKEKEEYYSYIFKMFQEDSNMIGDSLKTSDALKAMNCANNSLVSEGKKDYIVMALRLLGISVEEKVNMQTFMLLLAFSEKILSLGESFQLSVEKIDFPHLLSCLSRAKQMYGILLRPGDRTIHREDFMIELKAAKVDQIIMNHITLENKKLFDFLDYLAYFPLFLHTHDAITNSPVA